MKKSTHAYTDYAHISYWDHLVGGVSDIVLKVDLDVNIAYINYRIEEYLGARSNYMGKSFRSLGIEGAEAELWTDTLRRAAVSKKPQLMVCHLLTKNKSLQQFETSVCPVLDSEGNTMAFTLIMRDLGARESYSLATEKWKVYKGVVIDLFKNSGQPETTGYDNFVNHTLQRVGVFFKLDRTYLFSYNAKAGSLSNTHEWCATGISREIDNLQDLPMAMLPDWVEKHMAGKSLVISDVKALNPNSFTRRTLESQGIKSLITQPVLVQGECVGFIGCDAVAKHRLFSQQDCDFLEIIADLLGVIAGHYAENGRDISSRPAVSNQKEEGSAWTKELEEFAFMSAHNFMSPLANMMGLIENADLTNKGEHALFIEQMKESVYRIKRTFDGMKKVMLSNEEPLAKFEPLRLSDCFREMCMLLQPQIEQSGLRISTLWETDEVVYCKAHIENIMLNLLSNAIKFKAQGRIPELKIHASRKADNHVLITFADNGIGIDLKTHGSELFGLYKRFHTDTEGSGVGLYTVKSQLERHGGKIDVQSEPGAGATFSVHLKTR